MTYGFRQARDPPLRKLLAEGSACGRGLSALVNLSARMHAGMLARPCQPAAVRRRFLSGPGVGRVGQ